MFDMNIVITEESATTGLDYPRRLFIAIAGLLFFLVLSPQLYAVEVAEILKQADHFRQPLTTAKVVTEVELYKNGKLDKKRLYHVYMKPGQRSLVLFQSAIELGQKVLMVKEKFWLLMPRSRRPIRITPMQKLLGEASTGDVATMTWSDYYKGEIVAEDVDKDGVRAIHLNLQSQSRATTYARIELWVDQSNYAPLAADLYVKSGKLAKQATYKMGMRDGKRQVVGMVLYDRIQKNRKTVVNTLSVKEATIPDKYYNPQYLARNPTLDL